MTDRELLKSLISKSGLKRSYIAEQLGITYQGFKLKLDGKNEFVESEMRTLSDLLRLTKTDRERIFFAKNVDKTST